MLESYYSMNQLMSETVALFVHRFLNCQHKLKKLIPGIHVSQENDAIELHKAFLITVRPEIKKNLCT